LPYKGYFKPSNLGKYKGDPTKNTKIINRTSVAVTAKKPTDTMFSNLKEGTQLMSIYSETTCAVCANTFASHKSLTNHIYRAHGISKNEYYDIYILEPDENICDNHCCEKTSFVSIRHGYKKYCNTCSRSLGAKRFRAELINDEKRFDAFTEKVSKNQTDIWESRKEDGTFDVIMEKVANANRENISKMTEKERIERFGWLNKISGSERDAAIEKITTPLIQFWKKEENEEKIKLAREKRKKTINSMSAEEKRTIESKKLETRYSLTVEQVEKWVQDKSSREAYYEAVWRVSNTSYNYYKHVIDPNNLRGFTDGEMYHLDHMYSIMQGFVNEICPTIIGHACNLQILTGNENLSKSANCWITLEELNENIRDFETKNKNTWVGQLLNGI
jgi:hypothetical protein